MSLVLLAPVPERHLVSGIKLSSGIVALGARDEKPFDRMDAERMGQPVPVLFYATHQASAQSGVTRHAATWAGEYVGRVRAKAGRHPEESMYRPSTTHTDRIGKWKFFYHVRSLRKLQPQEHVEIAALRGYGAKNPYQNAPVRKPRLAVR